MTVTWFNPGGGEQQDEHWEDAGATTIGLHLSREDLKGQPDIWWEVLVLFNPHDGDVDFVVPEREGGNEWLVEINTAAVPGEPVRKLTAGEPVTMTSRSLLLLR
jgi:glycogen operon protein